MSGNTFLEMALANLAYSVAYADGKLEESELRTFEEMLVKELKGAAVSVRNKFLLLGERSSPNIEQAYREAMFAIKENKLHFDENLKKQFILILEEIAKSVEGIREEERNIIERFKRDIPLI